MSADLAYADDCSCPVVQCDPCQKKLILGTQIKECSKPPAVVCQKIVCENVDNYFQCIAGAPPLYIPPQDPSLRYSEPRFTAPPEKPREIDFAKLNKAPAKPEDTLPAKEDIPAPSGEAFIPMEKMRQPASMASASSTEHSSNWSVNIKLEKGEVYQGKHKLKKLSSYHQAVSLVAKSSAHLLLHFEKDVIALRLEKGTKLDIGVQEGVLLMSQFQGVAEVDVKSSRDLFVADLGPWRYGKKSGAFKIRHLNAETLLENQLGEAYLRRENLISQTHVIEPQVQLQIEDGAELYSAVPLSPMGQAQVYSLESAQKSKADSQERQPAEANSSFCNSPSATYEQCAWKCFGASQGAQKCASQNAAAKCVRFTCAADGQWKLPTVVPEGECALDKIQVGLCH